MNFHWCAVVETVCRCVCVGVCLESFISHGMRGEILHTADQTPTTAACSRNIGHVYKSWYGEQRENQKEFVCRDVCHCLSLSLFICVCRVSVSVCWCVSARVLSSSLCLCAHVCLLRSRSASVCGALSVCVCDHAFAHTLQCLC